MHFSPLILAVAGCLDHSTPARCLCAPTPPLTTRAEASALLAEETGGVFEGRILAIRLRQDSTLLDSASGRHWRYDVLVATVQVKRRWSSGVADSVHVETMAQTTMCGLDLVAGQRYLFVAERSERGERERTGRHEQSTMVWSVSKCGHSRVFDREARRVARLLGPSRIPK